LLHDQQLAETAHLLTRPAATARTALPSRARRKTPAADWNTALAQKFSRGKNKFPRNVENITITARDNARPVRELDEVARRVARTTSTDNVGYARQLAEADAP